MNTKRIEALAQMTQTSKPTVSKVLNHCFGVDHETRIKVLSAAKEQDISHEQEKDTDIYVILPDNPKYFWNSAYKGLLASSDGLNCKFNIYSKFHDIEEVEEYLMQACRQNAKVIVISVASSPRIYDLLQKISLKIPILLLSEYMDITNTFFVGNDSYRDGYRLGEVYNHHFSQYGRIICFENTKSYNQVQRTAGFMNAISSSSIDVRKIPLPKQSKTLAAQLSRILCDNIKDTFDAIFCTDGILPQVCLAVNKLGLKGKVICMGFENPVGSTMYIDNGIIAAFIKQDIFKQGEKAMKLAAEYVKTDTFPAAKCTYIESQLFVNPKTKQQATNTITG